MKRPLAFSPAFRQEFSRMRRAMIIAVLSVLTLAHAPMEQEVRVEAASTAQCQYVVRPLMRSFAAPGGSGSLTILAAENCSWTATSNAPWITVVSNPGSVLGQGRVNYSVLANPESNQRSGTITVAGQTITLTQAGSSAQGCAVTAINTGQSVNGALAPGDCQSLRLKDGAHPLADRYSFNATAGQPVIISLTSADLDPYLYLLDANGSVIAQNDDTAAGANSRIPGNNSFFAVPASGSFIIEVTSFASGGQGNYVLSLTTPSGNCTYSINPTGEAFPSTSGASVVSVNTQASCAWGSVSNNNWLMITASGSSGPGAVNFSVAANAGVARTGSLTVAGLTFTVTQAGTNGTGCPTSGIVSPGSGGPGSAITITGTNLTGVTAVRFTNNVVAQFTVTSDTQITTTVPTGAVTGPLTLVKPACPDTQTNSFTVSRVVTTVSAANFVGVSLATESIVAAFGTGLATGLSVANSVPLPTTMLGTTVVVKDSGGAERPAPLFFVSTDQINYQIPPGTLTGPATVTVTSGDGIVSSGPVNIATVAPGVFSANSTGQGVAAAQVLRFKADASQTLEPVAIFDIPGNQFVTLPIDLGPDLGAASDQLFLILYGTGLRFRSTVAAVICTIGDVSSEVLFAGPQGTFVGLDQINVRLPRTLAGRGEVDVLLSVDGKPANAVRINVK